METDAGTPDIENIMAISELFGISMDEPKRYDMKLGGVNIITHRLRLLLISVIDSENGRVFPTSLCSSALRLLLLNGI